MSADGVNKSVERQSSMAAFLADDERSSRLSAHQLSTKATTHIELEQAISDTQKMNCDRMINHFHGYTPNTNRVGRYIDWLIKKSEIERDEHGRVIKTLRSEYIGTIGLMDTPALLLGARDRLVRWNREQQKRNMHKLVANYRFTMLPHAQKNDASRALSIMLKICQKQWLEKYGKPIVFIETVVKSRKIDGEVMTGQCYKAAGFKFLGLTSANGTCFHTLKFNQKAANPERAEILFKKKRLFVYAKPLVENYLEELRK